MKLPTALKFTSSMAEVTGRAAMQWMNIFARRGPRERDKDGAGLIRNEQARKKTDRLGTASPPRNQVRGRDGGGPNK
jgi:hypothetical protein